MRVARSLAIAALVAIPDAGRAEPRDRGTAQALSGIGTGVSSALFLTSFWVSAEEGEVNRPLLYTGLATSVITPSLGEWYAGQWLTIGMGVRVGAALVAAYAVQQTEQIRCITPDAMTCTSITGTGIALLGVAAIAYVGGAAYDVMNADEAVDRYNARGSVMVSPSVLGGGPGVAIAGSF